jgi:cysteine synthase
MNKFEKISAMINNTPILEISLKYQGLQRTVYAKAEYYNFTGSIKDRIAYNILKGSYEAGLIKRGDIIAEASSGNTGIAFSAIGAYLGNPVHIFMPDWMSEERKKLLESFGATIHLVSKEDGGFKGSVESADKFGAENNAFLPYQFSNFLNAETHYKTTGAEILRQLDTIGKKPDGFVAGVGTGGTIMGKVPSDWESAAKIIELLGYEQKRPGYKHRRSYMYENILFEIDTWDEQTYTKPYLEIEVTSDEELEKAIAMLNLDRNQITTKPIDELRKD